MKNKEERILEGSIVIIGLITLLVVTYLITRLSISTDYRFLNNLGVIGDFIGGIIGVLLSVLTVVFIYITYKNQGKAARIQQFEISFFSLLQNQREILKSMSGYFIKTGKENNFFLKDSDFVNTISVDYVSKVASELESSFKSLFFVEGIGPYNFLDVKNTKEDISDKVNHIYKEVYKSKASELGHYFRHLYHIFKYISESEIDNKKKYIDIIQAQMSDDELYITFYNGISDYGKLRFLPMLNDFQFFENIRSRGEVFDLHANVFYPNTKFKYPSK